MDVSIVGLPKSGKTTIFNAVTRGSAETATYGAVEKPNIGVAKVADGRLDRLAEVFNPKRSVPAEVVYVDVPSAPEDLGESGGLAGELLNHLQSADALLVAVRAFDNPSVPHPRGGVDPYRDVETMLAELALADMTVLERRLTRIAEGAKGARAPEREALDRERALLGRLQAGLESGAALREQALTVDEERALEGFQLLTAKPLIILFNVGEDRISEIPTLEEDTASRWSGPAVRTAALCAKLEMELTEMEPEDEVEFRESLELTDAGIDRMMRVSHEVSDLVTFFTGNDNEVRAWTVARGTQVSRAAGKVHTDLERGFIRAQVVGFHDLSRCGTVAEARRRGLVRQEGKGYTVGEGDVINVLFNV